MEIEKMPTKKIKLLFPVVVALSACDPAESSTE